VEKPKNSAPKAKSAHLRSPLLGGMDDDEISDEPVSRPLKGKAPQSKAGGKMRSPLLGGAGPASDDDYEEDFPLRDRNDDRSPFPHRSRPRETDHEMPAPQQHSGKAHLRSPLLGGSDDDEYEEEQFQSQPQGRKQSQGNARPQKLHSPIFDRQSSGPTYDDYEDDYDAEDIDDPNVLRSPLLAAKSRLPQGRQNQNQPRPYPPADAQPSPLNSSPNIPQPGQQPGAYNQANLNQAANNQQQYGQQQFNQPAYQQQPGQQQFAQPGQFPQPAPGHAPLAQPPAQHALPQQPVYNSPPQNTQQPAFAPAPPLNPNASQNGLLAAPNPAAAITNPTGAYEYGAPGASLVNSPSQQTGFPAAVSGGQSQRSTILESSVQSPQPSPQASKPPIFPTVVNATASGAALAASAKGSSSTIDQDEFPEHPAVEDLAPAPKAKPAKLGGGRFGQAPATPSLDDDQDDPDSSHGARGLPLSAQQGMNRKRSTSASEHDAHSGAASAGAPAGPIMVIFITGFIAAIAKAYWIFLCWNSLIASMPMLLEQVTQLALYVGLIIFAAQGTRK
jgi:hypothetical protein